MAFPKIPWGDETPRRHVPREGMEVGGKPPTVPGTKPRDEVKKMWINTRYGRLPENGAAPPERVARDAFEKKRHDVKPGERAYTDRQIETRMRQPIELAQQRLSEPGRKEFENIRKELHEDLVKEEARQQETREERMMRTENRMLRDELIQQQQAAAHGVRGAVRDPGDIRDQAASFVRKQDQAARDLVIDRAELKLDCMWERETGERLSEPSMDREVSRDVEQSR
ncbi:MAG: hypothetical protein AAFV45_14990 [Pseudomonadota bacterium]